MKQGKPKVVITLGGIFIAVFVIFAYAYPSIEKSTPEEVVVVITSDLPEIPETEYYYPEQLKNPDESNFDSTYEVPETLHYKVQCGTFRTLEKAKLLVSNLSAITKMNIISQGELHVVISGLLLSKRAGEALRKRASREAKIYGCILKKQL